MKETNRTSRTAGQLEKMFRALNHDLFGDEIEEPIITIQSTPRAYGHCTVQKAWKAGAENVERHELNIGAENLERPIENVTATLIHEMVHLYNIKRNVQDCSRGGSYHNKIFRDEAEKRMLKISHHETYGWTITEPTEELLDYIIEKGWTELQMNRDTYGFGFGIPGGRGAGQNGKPTTAGTEKQKTSWKHTCPKCGLIARTTKAAKLKCFDCDLEMVVD